MRFLLDFISLLFFVLFLFSFLFSFFFISKSRHKFPKPQRGLAQHIFGSFSVLWFFWRVHSYFVFPIACHGANPLDDVACLPFFGTLCSYDFIFSCPFAAF